MSNDTSKSSPRGWRIARFGDVVRNVKVDVDPETSGLERYIAGEHMETDNLHIRQWGTIGDGYLGPAFHRKFVKGQVLYGSRRTYLRKVAMAEFDGICANTTFVLETQEGVLLQELLPFVMQTEGFTQHSILHSKGSVNPYVNWKDIACYEFPLPPLGEQRRIVDILWAADQAIQYAQTVLSSVQALRTSVREETICNPEYPRRRLDACLHNIVAGKSVRGRNEPAGPDEFGVLKVSAVGPNKFVPEENKTLLDFGDFLPQFKVRAGDVLITRCNTRELVGRVCITSSAHDNLMLCDKTLRLDIRENVATRGFVVEALRSREARLQIEAAASGTGGAMKNISQADIRGFIIPLPDVEVQRHIESAIAETVAAQRAVESHLERSRALFRTLLGKLLNHCRIEEPPHP